MRAISVQAAFWTAVILGVLAVMSVPSAVVLGIAEALLFWLAAWSIRRGNGWAALAAAVLLAIPAATAAQAVRMPAVALTLLVFVEGALVWGGVTLLLRGGARSRRESAAWIVLAVGVVAFFATMRVMVMPSASMENTVVQGERLLVETVSRRLGSQPGRDELIVFHAPADARQIFLKRVIGVPGDRIQLVKQQLYRNGMPVSEPYVTHQPAGTPGYRDDFPGTPPLQLAATGQDLLQNHVLNGTVEVPAGKLFVLGDNRDSSVDSRFWGFVDQGAVIGRPWLVYGSMNTAIQFRLLARTPAR